MKILNALFFIGLMTGFYSTSAQDILLEKCAEPFQAEKKYYSDYYWDGFYDSGLADQPMDQEVHDQNLINASVYFVLNQFREQGLIDMLDYNISLEKLAFHLHHIWVDPNNNLDVENYPLALIREAGHICGFNGSYFKILVFKSDKEIPQDQSVLDFAKEIVLDWKFNQAELLREVAYDSVGCFVNYNDKTKQTRAVLVLGGYRLKFFEDKEK